MPPRAVQPQPRSAAPGYAKRAWKLAEQTRPRIGKRFNTASVVDTAVELADESGLAGVSIRNLAQRLGLTPMAIYRHVDSRDELIVLMVDVVLGFPPEARLGSGSWPDALLRWGRSLYQRYEAHPWVLDAPIPGMPWTPNLVQWVDRILGDLEPAGLPIRERLDIALLIAGHVRHIANVRLQIRPLHPAESLSDLRAWLPHFVTPETFPFYARIFNTGVFGHPDGPDLDYGLERIIDGVRARSAALRTDMSG
jgi:AcrR family transcriptional regulator